MLPGYGDTRVPLLIRALVPAVLALTLSASAHALSILAYPSTPSVAPGGAISFHVSTDLPDFDIRIYRFGAQIETVSEFKNIAGHSYPTPVQAYATGCGWPEAFTFTVPAHWRSGAYAVSFHRGLVYTYTFFVVKPKEYGRNSGVLYVVPVATYHAYNTFGGKCLYDGLSSNLQRASKVSLDRPYSSSNGLGGFEGYEQPFVQWMEKNGIVPDYVTGIDLCMHPEILDHYRLVTTAGHDEYWTMTRRQAMDAYVAGGRNIALFSANAAYWAIRVEDDGHSIVCYKDAAQDPMTAIDPMQATVQFRDPPLNMPEAQLLGVMYAGNSNFVGRPAVVADRDHWIFDGTNVQVGDSLGTNIVGYEWDNVFPSSPAGVRSLLQTSLAGIFNLPTYSVTSYFEQSPEYGFPNGHGGKVFSAGTVQWSWGLDDLGYTHPDATIQRITKNVFDHLSQATVTGRSVDVLFRADARALHLKATDPVELVAGTPEIGYSDGVPLADDGAGADSVAGDGVYTARVTLGAGTPVPFPYGYHINHQPAMLVSTPGLAWIRDSGEEDSPQVLAMDAIARPGLVGTPAPAPATLRLHVFANSPNPFRGLTRIHYIVPGVTAPGRVDDGDDDEDESQNAADAGVGTRARADVFDAGGRRVRTLLDGYVLPGEGSVSWDGRDASGQLVGTGIYFCRMTAGMQKTSIKMLRVR